ncbi:3-ketodihydrosphingosine reductase [Procambarus clarkii]|uniref:3-ketodihydrosphingosine reductase n=1 Tax=Procambarus clarkii TaxID=6728 RepID=UPI001E677D4A|nr:3-ketodihydrosphingosine reductase-like [Procambarus clarkii]XP_045617478.1 3-ketodihydrosphingosine reductase-like [Procambarus clarkii]XP_045617479.1 3-ketodihydrosphingosine reductase-like [Procambarus clarkii]
MGLCCGISWLYAILVTALGIALCNIFTRKKKDLKGKHVLITGGSSGIGLSVAHDVAGRGANVTLIARSVSNLEKARDEVAGTISKVASGGKVQFFSADLSGSPEKVSLAVKSAEASLGPVFMLVNCAGFSRAQKFEDISPQLLKQMMDVNYTGSFIITQEVVRSMKQQREGVVVFTSSQAGLLGLYGFTAYSAAKSALVKLAESLHMEVKPYNITVTVCYPPDTDTPGFEEENKTKPVETKLISEAAGLFKADDVAKQLVEDALSGSFSSTVGFEGFLLTTLCAGMGPITDAKSFMAQVFLSGIIRVITSFYLWKFARTVEGEYKKRAAGKKSE